MPLIRSTFYLPFIETNKLNSVFSSSWNKHTNQYCW